MPIEQEVDSGLKLFNQILRAYGKLELREARPLSGRRAYYAVIGSRDEGLKQVDIVLSYEFLSDLPNTPEYQLSAQIYGRSVAGRMGNPHPMDFYCKAGLPIRVEIDWPFESIAQRAASFVHVSIENLRRRNLYAKCSFIMSHQQFIFDLQKNSFLREAAIINTARRAVDGGRLTFYPREEHPVQLIEFPLDTQFRPSGPAVAIDQFIAGKVFWLGFRQGD